MAKNIDYSKLKALSQQIIECIGDDEHVGENPDIPKPKVEKGSFEDVGTSEFGSRGYESNGDQEPLLDFLGNELADGKDEEGEAPDEDDAVKKKKKEASLAMMGSMLASKFNK